MESARVSSRTSFLYVSLCCLKNLDHVLRKVNRHESSIISKRLLTRLVWRDLFAPALTVGSCITRDKLCFTIIGVLRLKGQVDLLRDMTIVEKTDDLLRVIEWLMNSD